MDWELQAVAVAATSRTGHRAAKGTVRAAIMGACGLYDRAGELISSHVGFLKSDGPKREKAIGAALESEE